METNSIHSNKVSSSGGWDLCLGCYRQTIQLYKSVTDTHFNNSSRQYHAKYINSCWHVLVHMPTLLMCRSTTSGASIIAEFKMCENVFLVTLYILAFLLPVYSVIPESQRVDNITNTLFSCHIDANEDTNSLQFGSSFPRTLFRFFRGVQARSMRIFCKPLLQSSSSPFLYAPTRESSSLSDADSLLSGSDLSPFNSGQQSFN